jgi:hypothetical protein
MKRLLFVALMMVCSVSWAEWEIFYATAEFTVYVDKSTIRRNGSVAKMWYMTDSLEADTNYSERKYKSTKVRRAFNCLEESSAAISFAQYSGSIGEGSVVTSGEVKESELQWNSVVPGTLSENLWKIACGKK